MAFAASKFALDDAKWNPQSELERERTGVFLGAIKSHLGPTIYTIEAVMRDGIRGVLDSYYTHTSVFDTTANVVKYFKFKGPASGYSSGCSAGSSSIAQAFFTIQNNEADVMVAGAADHGIHPYLLNGLARVEALNKKSNDFPEKASSPFDEKRQGFVASDGAGVLILEELEHALERRAHIYGEIRGVSLYTESFHPTRPHAEGDGIGRTMKRALENSGIEPSEVDLIHSHGTSTFEGDLAEVKAMSRLFKTSRPVIISGKSNYGHMMAGVGGIQAAVLLLCMQHSMIPPILNLENPIQIDGEELNFARNLIQKEVKVGISNNAAFGGFNVTIVFSKLS